MVGKNILALRSSSVVKGVTKMEEKDKGKYSIYLDFNRCGIRKYKVLNESKKVVAELRHTGKDKDYFTISLPGELTFRGNTYKELEEDLERLKPGEELNVDSALIDALKEAPLLKEGA